MPTCTRLERGLGVVVVAAWALGVYVYIQREWRSPSRPGGAPAEEIIRDLATPPLSGDEVASWLENMDSQKRAALHDYDGALRVARAAGERPIMQVYLESTRSRRND